MRRAEASGINPTVTVIQRAFALPGTPLSELMPLTDRVASTRRPVTVIV